MTILYYPDLTIHISTWHMFALVSSCFPLVSTIVTSQFWVFLSQPSLPTSRINLAQALGARHKPPDSAETEMPWDAHRMQTSKVTMRALTRRVSESIGEYLTKGCHKCFQPVILHMASFSEGKSSWGIKALLWPMLYFEDFDTRDITQTTFITFYNHTSWHQSDRSRRRRRVLHSRWLPEFYVPVCQGILSNLVCGPPQVSTILWILFVLFILAVLTLVRPSEPEPRDKIEELRIHRNKSLLKVESWNIHV